MSFGVESLDFFTHSELFRADIIGCMDENNLNYDPDANINDGDKCGGCIQGFTRIGESSFTCQEVGGKYIDCKTTEVFWKLKSDFSYRPANESANCRWWNHVNECMSINVRTIDNNGLLFIKNESNAKAIGRVTWRKKFQEIENECGSLEVLPVTPEEVPNFLPASSTPPVSYSQDLSTQTDTDTDTDTDTEEPKGTNWLLIGGLAIGAYFLMG
jgi:hypothetical protein